MKERVLFQSDSHEQEVDDVDWDPETILLNSVLLGIKKIFGPSILVGTIGRWNGTFKGYKYCPTFQDLQNAISGYEDITIRQIGTRLHFTLTHHDGRHEMELRRLSDYGYEKRDNACFDYFNDEALRFINRYTKNYGRISDC